MNEYKLKGYVARDKGVYGIGELFFGTEKPIWVEELGMWTDFGDNLMKLPTDWLLDLKYTDEPIDVELTIRCRTDNKIEIKMNEYKLNGYVARDKKNGHNHTLFFYRFKPIYNKGCGMWLWDDFGGFMELLNDDWFPELKHTDEPIEVELTIKKL